jgi:hypothetical protein
MSHRRYLALIATAVVTAILLYGLATRHAVAAPDEKATVSDVPLLLNITSNKNNIHAA